MLARGLEDHVPRERVDDGDAVMQDAEMADDEGTRAENPCGREEFCVEWSEEEGIVEATVLYRVLANTVFSHVRKEIKKKEEREQESVVQGACELSLCLSVCLSVCLCL